VFQSTPVIANGRIRCTAHNQYRHYAFQSTPVIANGRIDLVADTLMTALGFQSTPVIANGRIVIVGSEEVIDGTVSIHARYC